MPQNISKAERGNDPPIATTPSIVITIGSISVSYFDDAGDWRVQAGVLKQGGTVRYRFSQQGDVDVAPGTYVHDVEGDMTGQGYISSTIEYD